MALTKFNYNSFDLTTAASKGLAFNSSANGFETSSAGAMTLIKSITASDDDNISFINGSSGVVLDSTYPVYLFKFINIHPYHNNVFFSFNASDDTSSHAFNLTKTTTAFSAKHNEADGTTGLAYDTGQDLAQSTDYATLCNDSLGNENDESSSGELYLFNPSSTTFVKHFFARLNIYHDADFTFDSYNAGYFNTTAAITAVDFKMNFGAIGAGTIKLYGIKDS